MPPVLDYPADLGRCSLLPIVLRDPEVGIRMIFLSELAAGRDFDFDRSAASDLLIDPDMPIHCPLTVLRSGGCRCRKASPINAYSLQLSVTSLLHMLF
jgi:hypothetical protein